MTTFVGARLLHSLNLRRPIQACLRRRALFRTLLFWSFGCFAIAWTWPASAVNRYWTGQNSANWSDPNNWNPAGTPQAGDDLLFGFNDDSHHSMVNDLSNVTIGILTFASSDYQIDGNSITLAEIDNDEEYNQATGHPSYTTTINCPLVFPAGICSVNTGGFPGEVTQTTIDLHLNGPITVLGELDLGAGASSDSGGGNGHLYVSGVVSGPGDVAAFADDQGGNVSSIQFDGTPGNTFSGTLFVATAGSAQIIFNKSSGFVATNRVATLRYNNPGFNAPNLNFAAPNQLGDHTAIEVTAGNSLFLSGNNVTVGSLVLTNAAADANASTLDLGSITVGLNYGLTSWNDNFSVTPIIKGKINLNGFVNCNIGGSVYAGLEIPATLASLGGLSKNGGIAMLLEASNSFTGAIAINSGTLDCRINGALGRSSGVQLNGGVLTLNSMDVPTESLTVTDPNSTLFTHGSCSWGGSITLEQSLLIYAFDSLQLPGTISGAGGLTLLGGSIEISGSSPNTFTGTTTTACSLLTLDKATVGAYAMSGQLVIGNSGGVTCEARWLGNSQLFDGTDGVTHQGTVTLFSGGLMNLNGQFQSLPELSFNGGVVSIGGGGLLSVDGGLVVVNPNSQPATVQGGQLQLPGSYGSFDIEPGQSSPELTVSSTIVSGGIYKTGAGTLALSGDNSFADGLVFIWDGVIDVSSPTALGATSSHTLVESGGTLLVEAGASGVAEPISLAGGGYAGDGALYLMPLAAVSSDITLAADATVRVDSGTGYLPGVISGSGALTKSGAGTLQLGANDTRANTYAGTTYVNAGTLLLFKATGIESVPGDLVIGGAHQPATAQNFNSFQIAGVVIVNAAGLWDLAGSAEGFDTNSLQGRPALSLNGNASVQTESGILYLPVGGDVYVNPVGAESSTATISGNLGLDPGPHHFVVNSGFTFHSTPDLDLAAALTETSGTASIAKDGFGEMSLDASNSFNGTVTVTGGALLVQNNHALGSAAAGTTVTNGGALYLANNTLVAAEPLTLSSSAQPALRVTFGSSEWDGPVQLASNSVVTVDDFAGALQMNGAIAGPGGWTKLGPGALRLGGTAPNTFTGLTLVSNGLFQASKSSAVLALGGNIVIGDDAEPATNATFSLIGGLLPATADLAVHASGLFDNESAATAIHTLTGAGYANFGAALTVSNDVSFEFDGRLSGAGALTKFGAGTMKLTADSPGFTGSAAISNGTYQIEGAISNSPVTVGAGATLVGNGVAGNVNTIGLGSFVRTDTRLPDHFGGNLGVGSFTVTNGGTLALNFYGNSKTRQNDGVVAAGSVTLSNAQLAAAFQYPPRDGDSVFLIQKSSAGAIAGAFDAFGEGAQTTIGTVPVSASYKGGDGNDFVLTVTNLALAYNGYRLAGGNENQTVEPNECNLLYVTLVSRRTNTLTITNTFLRITSPGAEVIIPQATFPPIPPNGSAENLTPFQFRTDPTMACHSTVNFDLVVGAAGEGLFDIAFSPVSGTDCTHPTGPCEFPVVFSGTFDSNSPALTAPLLFDGDPSSCFPPKTCPGLDTNLPSVRYAVYNFTNTSPGDLCIGAVAQFTCSNAPANALGAAAYLGSFDPMQPCANYLGDNGGSGPPFSTFYFQVPAGAPFCVVVMDRTNDFTCNAYTLEMLGLPDEPPTMLSTWANHAGGDWNTATNWDVHLLPTVTSNALIQDLGFYFTVTNNLPVTFYEFRFNDNAATLTGTGDLTLNGPFRWGSGQLDGSSSIVANGGLQISNGLLKSLSRKTLVNNAAAIWNGGSTIFLANGGIISNSPSGTFDCTDDGIIEGGGVGTAFANGGLFRKLAGTNSTTIQSTFFNSGTVQIQSGSLYCYGGLTNFGDITVPMGGTLILGSEGSSSSPGSAITGAGNLLVNGPANLAGTVNFGGSNTFNFSGSYTANLTGNYVCTNNALTIGSGTANFNGTGVVAPATLTLNIFGILGGSNLVTVSGPSFLGTSTGLSGLNSVVANGGLTIFQNVALSGRTLVNTASALWTNSSAGVVSLSLNNGAVLSNAPGATFQFDGNGAVQSGGSGGTLLNAGTLRKTGTGSTSTIQVPLTNSGPVSVETGALAISAGGTTTGDITVAAGAAINFGGGTFTLPPGVGITGPGNFAVNAGTPNFAGLVNLGGSNTFTGGTATFTGNYICTNNALSISSGTATFNGTGVIAPATLTMGLFGVLGGSEIVTVSGPATLNSGASLTGTNLVLANGGLTISGGLGISGRTLANNGVALWTNTSGASISLLSGGTLSNAPTGTLLCLGSGTFVNSGGAVVNQGLFRIAGPPAITTMQAPFSNQGTLELDSGTLSFPGLAYLQTAGVTFLNGGGFANSSPLQILGGTLTGAGLIAGSVTNAGRLSPGAPIGQLTISGNYTQGLTGTLQIDLGGTNLSTGFDRLVVSNATRLAGSLSVLLTNGFAPLVGSQFQVLSCSNVSGSFNALDLPTGFSVNYSNNGVFLVVTGAVAVPVTLQNPQVSGQTFSFSFQTVPEQSYTLLQNTNLSTTNWFPVTNFTGDGSLYHFTFPFSNDLQRYFRAREP